MLMELGHKSVFRLQGVCPKDFFPKMLTQGDFSHLLWLKKPQIPL